MKQNFGLVMVVVMLVGFGSLLVWYGDTEVAFKEEGGILYRQIKNGRVGANCYDENGTKVIAPSRFFGPEWTPVAESKDGDEIHTYSIACYPYRSEPIAASFSR